MLGILASALTKASKFFRLFTHASFLEGNIYLDERYIIDRIKIDAGVDRKIPINERIFPIVQKLYVQNKKKLLEMHEKVFYNN